MNDHRANPSPLYVNRPNKFVAALKSRKFWALIAAAVAAAAALSLGEITQLDALRLIVEALMVYIGAVAVEDGLSRR